MKKNILTILLISGAAIALTITGCSKDDTTAPVVTLVGPESIEISLNSGAWSDLGATANDDEDGDLSAVVTSDASSTNPNVNLVGFYTITYTATDKAGNIGSETRSIYVKNDADDYAGTYDVHDTVPGFVFDYTQEITVSTTENNRVHFSRFGDYANNTGIYATKLGSGFLQVNAGQIGVDIGSGAGTCDIATHTFGGQPSTGDPATSFTFTYTDQITSPGSCVGTTTGTATYTRQ
jgi:hypothetical protein